MKVINKLVRDYVPEILREDNQNPIIKVLDDYEYEPALHKEMSQILKEYFETGDITKLVDLGEVMHALLDFKGITIKEYQDLRLQKLAKEGSYKKRIFLEYIVAK